MNEIWKTHPDMPEYEISNIGRVKRLQRTYIRSDGFSTTIKERLLNPQKNKDGYPRVRLRNKHIFVHKLVLETFIGFQPSKRHQACHNNGTPDDNCLDNLRWDLPSNNVRDRIRHGTYQIGEKNHQNKYPDDLIINLANSDKSIRETASYYNVSRKLVWYARYKKKIKKGVFSEHYQVVG